MYLYIISRVNILVYLNTNFFILNESFQCFAYVKVIIGELVVAKLKGNLKFSAYSKRKKKDGEFCFVSEK